eukprot:g14720.t1
MMAGPNQGQKPSFFADWPVLEAELKVYLAERRAGDPENGGDAKPRGAGGALLNLLSVNPAKMAVENDPDKDEWDGEVNVLSYSELTRYGYGYLIEPMMKSGGYVAASERMGIALNNRTLKDNEYYERINPTVGLDMNKKADKDGFLTLGSAREERLNSVASITREERRKSLFEKQAMMDKGQKAKAKAEKSQASLLNPKRRKGPVSLGGRTQQEVDEELYRKPGLPEEQRDISEWVPEVRAEDALPPQPLLLNFVQRVNAVAVCACLALAFGKGTVDALETGLLPAELAEVAVPASLFLLGLNVASAVAGASIAKVLLALCAFAVSDGFVGQVSPRSSKSTLRMSASQPSGLDGTRRDVIKTASAAVAGVLASTAALPGAALAAAKPDPNRKVFTTAGGVKFIVLKEGVGPVARDGDFCVVEFTGFLPDGSVFDASNAPGRKPIAFKLGARQVIKGWEEVLRLMNAGAEVQMVVPADMAFGDKGICIDNGECLVKPGSEVRYDLQLKRVAPTP